MNFRYVSNVLAFIGWPGGIAWAALMFDRLQTPGTSAGWQDYALDVVLPAAIAAICGLYRLSVLIRNAVNPPQATNPNQTLIAKLAARYAIAGDAAGLDLVKDLAVRERGK